MKTKYEEIDELIHQVLSKEEAEFYDKLEEDQTIYHMITGLFTGAFKWPAIFSAIITLVFLIVGVYSVIQFFDSTETKELLMWFGGFVFSCFVVVMNKILHWTQVSVNTLQREIKRLELQIAAMAKSLNNND